MMADIIHREFIYLWFYLTILIDQIAPYWIAGILIGSTISVFGKKKIHGMVDVLRTRDIGIVGIVPASILGAISPLCLYGTIPIAAACAQKGMREDWLAAFMMSSVLLNPQMIVYSMALGKTVFFIRIASCLAMGLLAGILVNIFFRNKKYFNFSGFELKADRDVHPNLALRLLLNIWRNVKTTGPYFLAGIILTALFESYVPEKSFVSLFGSNRRFGVLMAATMGVPLYVCGGGTIPLLREWLTQGMSVGAAAAFLISGPAAKLTNLTALKMVLGMKHFIFYFLFSLGYATVIGIVCNLFF